MKLPHWEARLTNVLRDWHMREFSWENNCAFFMGDAVEAQTGIDPVRDLRGNLGSAQAWREYLRGRGGLARAVTERLGDPVAPEESDLGDIVLHSNGTSLGVNVGGRAAFLNRRGWVVEPLNRCKKAWMVGRG